MLGTVLAHGIRTIRNSSCLPWVLMTPRSPSAAWSSSTFIPSCTLDFSLAAYAGPSCLHCLLDSRAWRWHHFPPCAQTKYPADILDSSLSSPPPSHQSPDCPFSLPNICPVPLTVCAVTCLNAGWLLLRMCYSGFPQNIGTWRTASQQVLDF